MGMIFMVGIGTHTGCLRQGIADWHFSSCAAHALDVYADRFDRSLRARVFIRRRQSWIRQRRLSSPTVGAAQKQYG
jgi:hypothetical protein